MITKSGIYVGLMINHQSCPIYLKPDDGDEFSPRRNEVVLPMDEQLTIVLRNNSLKRMLVVVGIRGLSLCDGLTLSSASDRGLIIQPNSTAMANTWLLSDEYPPLIFNQLPPSICIFDEPVSDKIQLWVYEELDPPRYGYAFENAGYQQIAPKAVGWGNSNPTPRTVFSEFARASGPIEIATIDVIHP